MDPIQCSFAADRQFGPSVSSCRREFDFTILFEEVVLVLIPACVFIPTACAVVVLRQGRTLTRPGRLHALKLVSATTLAAVQIVVLALQARLAHRTAASVASAVLSLVASVLIPAVSHFDHMRSMRPSAVLVTFLSLTCLFEAVRTRTYWLSGEVALAAALSTSLGIRLVILYLETLSKKGLLLAQDEVVAGERLAGPISRTLFYWLIGLVRKGYCGIIQPDDLDPIDDHLLTTHLRPKFQNINKRYGRGAGNSKQRGLLTGNGLIALTFTTLGRTWFGPIVARLAVAAFTFTQPFLANAALAYLEADDPVPASHGYGLIGAAFLCYVGIAAATGWYWHLAYRCAVMIRCGLATTIFDKLLRVPEGQEVPALATTLMVDDLQRIMSAIARGHEIWAGVIETGLATWLLYRQLGPSCFVMLGLAAASGLLSLQIIKKTGGSQQKWLAATQKRLKVTKQVLDNLKGVKMTSQDHVAYRALADHRASEINDSASFRWFMLLSNFLSYCPMTLSPPLLFGVHVATARSGYDFSVSKVFTSLVIVTLLSAPLVRLFQVVPQLGGAQGCFHRLHQFLLLEERNEYRETMSADEKSGEEDAPIMSLRDVCFGWDAESSPVLKHISLHIKRGTRVAIIGSVGTGKTLFLKGLIGEAHKTHGKIMVAPSTTTAYCSQTAWLENVSAQQNLTQYGREPSNSEFYRGLTSDCALEDIVQLPTFASESIGSGGVKLSGGQRQRLQLLLSTPVHPATTLKAFLTEHIANLADKVYRIDNAGHLLQITDLSLPKVLTSTTLSEKESVDNSEDDSIEVTAPSRVSPSEEKSNQLASKLQKPLVGMERQAAKQTLGDRAVYKTYFKSVGLIHTTIFLVGAMAWSVSFKFPDIWVQWWSDAPNSGADRLGYWLGIYAALGCIALIVLSAWVYHQQFGVISRSGKRLHSQLATTVLRAQFHVMSQVDTGNILNYFSQDLMFVDMQLPIDLFNTSSEFFTALIQIVLITVVSLPMLSAVPVLVAVLYVVQRFYLRTSKQLRLQDLEAKAALITKIGETASDAGLSTIRAHGWSDTTTSRFLERLDRSQEPLYLLYSLQRWLQVVLGLVVAGTVVAVLGASVALKISSTVSAGAMGVAFLNAVTLGETLTQLILAWTGLETSLGAIARIALLERHTPVEDSAVLQGGPPGGGGASGRGAIRIENVWATYSADACVDNPDPGVKWSLRGVNLDIQPGERIALCGRTGSGKSTLHLALLRMVNIPFGSITIDGVDHTTMPLKALRSSFLVISQDKLKSFGTIREELDPHGVFSDHKIEAVLLECGILDALRNAPGGLATQRGDCKFSDGEEQLLSVARVILENERCCATPGNESRIVLLDEITSRYVESSRSNLFMAHLGATIDQD
ncbi:canalicular multispecific organic anion transporter 1 [Diaporthe helianthi]|uniref:Canalicular multispecific organic anion transporter 1 n=1 Tax=Diaporthe helianthi TaxID=158607 RepID=A0A2P5HNK9_DIAHE|nr:canalicular multispecific organic anion transporter 1 [Diaporthe helianthi]